MGEFPNTHEIQMRLKIQTAGEAFRPRTRRFFFLRACLCKYNKVGITRQGDVRAFAMVPNARTWPIFVACQRKGWFKCPRRRIAFVLVTTSKRIATVSLASHNVRDTRSCAGWLRPSTRERSSTPLARAWCWLPSVRKTCADRVSFSVVFSQLKHVYTHRRGLGKKSSLRLVPNISCVRLICFTNIDMSRASPRSSL